eukprot:637755-Prymnesium_polylepis.1
MLARIMKGCVRASARLHTASPLPQRTLCSARTHAKATSMLNMFRKMTMLWQIRKWQCDDMRRLSLRSHACDATNMEDVIMSGKLEKPGPLTCYVALASQRDAREAALRCENGRSWLNSHGELFWKRMSWCVATCLIDPATCLVVVLWIRGMGFEWLLLENHHQIARPRDYATTHLEAQEQ